MVEHVIRTAGCNVPVKTITASRGKAVRAEPIASLYAQGKVCHVGRFAQLEEQMLNMSSSGEPPSQIRQLFEPPPERCEDGSHSSPVATPRSCSSHSPATRTNAR